MGKIKNIIGFFVLTLFVFLLSGCDLFNKQGTTVSTTVDTTTNITTDNNETIYSDTTQATDTFTTDKQIFEVNFDSLGGSNVEKIYVEEGSSVTLPVAVKEGYSFLGWFTGLGLSDMQIRDTAFITFDITLYAKWSINQYTISFNSEGGSEINSITDYFNANVYEPDIPVKDGYTFQGWYSDEEFNYQYGFNTMPAEDITLYAKWAVNYYTISFDSNEGTQIASITQDYGTVVVAPVEPTKVGYVFDGWYSDEEFSNLFVFNLMPAEYIHLYAKWTLIEYNITYYLNGGVNGENPTKYSYESGQITLAYPTKEGYTFRGWYNNENFDGDPITRIYSTQMENINLYANWDINTYVLNYVIFENYDPLGEVYTGKTTKQIEIGNLHYLALSTDNELYSWGSNSSGEMGCACDWYNMTVPIQITDNFNLKTGEIITDFSTGQSHTSVLTSEGRLFTFGNNEYGQLGDGTNTNAFSPMDITDEFNLNQDEEIISVSLGYWHSAVITSEGRLFTWGYNNYGQLGNGTQTNSNIPIDISSNFNLDIGEKITNISLGGYHSAAITSEGRMFMWGLNRDGQLGVGGYNDINTLPIEITNNFTLDLEDKLISASLGKFYSSAISSEGRVFTWGQNIYFQLGDGTAIRKNLPMEITNNINLDVNEKVISIDLSGAQSSVITSNNRVFYWGFIHIGSERNGDIYNSMFKTPTYFFYNSVYSVDRIFVQYNDSLPIIEPNRIGYVISEWYIDVDMTVQSTLTTMPGQSTDLYAIWIPN